MRDPAKSLGRADGDIVFDEFVGAETFRGGRLKLPEESGIKILRAGRYAVFTHRGPIDTLSRTYDYIWGNWILSTEEILDDKEEFEV